jgi:hypothetical protein
VGLGLVSLGGLISNISLVGIIGLSLISHYGCIGFIGLGVSFIGHGISLFGLGGHNGDISLIGLDFVLSTRWLIDFIGLGIEGLISLVSFSGINGLIGQTGLISLVSLSGFGLISLIGLSLARLIGHISLTGLTGDIGFISLFGYIGLIGHISHNSLAGITGLSLFQWSFKFKTHGVAIKSSNATKITNAAIWYYCTAYYWVVREGLLWHVPRLDSSPSYHDDVLQYAKQLLFVRILVMTKYCIMRECENILHGFLYVFDLGFVILKGIYGFKFPKRFLEISSRDFTSSSLFCQF